MKERRTISLFSPYHGGSHRSWAEGYQAHSRNHVDLFTLPDRFWKWRMHGGALTLAREFLRSGKRPDCIISTDMLDVSVFLSLTREVTGQTPTILYMHENQLTYPLPDDPEIGSMRRQKGERDLHYAFINLSSMLASDEVVFNSEYHRSSMFEALPKYLKHFPDYNELSLIEKLEMKSHVMPVGIELANLKSARKPHDKLSAPLILWNHRWEYDKNPEEFFEALYVIKQMEIPFRLALCGQSFRQQPVEFERAIEKLSDEIIHYGYADRATYLKLMWEADITVSTAEHEFFGLSTVEAICCHTFPILPDALSYPELIPPDYHARCLYQNHAQLINRIKSALENVSEHRAEAEILARSMARFDWQFVARRYDEEVEEWCR